MIRYLMTYGNSDRILAEYNRDITTNFNDISSLKVTKTIREDLVPVIQTGTVSTVDIPKDVYFYLNKTMVYSLLAIPEGVSFIENSNYRTVPPGALNELEADVIILQDKLPFRFGIATNGKYGYIRPNTSTVIPFDLLVPVNPQSTTDLNFYILE